jgi:hypothetical protein
MKLGVLGTDPDLLRLVAAAIDTGHEIEWLGDVRPEDAAAIDALITPTTQRGLEWELILDQGTVDAVLVGRGLAIAELRAEQLKRLAAEAMPMLVVHPACESVLPYYEVDMARREMGGLVRHYNPAAGHPIFAELAAWVRDGHPQIGTVHQVTCERRVKSTSRAAVVDQLARDAEPLAIVTGDIKRVSAVGPIKGLGSFASLQVQMTCSGAASARWSVGSLAGAEHDMVLTLVGERGTVALQAYSDSADLIRPWALETVTAEGRDQETLEPRDSARIAIKEFAAAFLAEREQRGGHSTWETATRAMEVVDAVELSLEKNRTVDVHQQQLTEKLAFRGTMAAFGCGLLLVGFFALVFVTMIGGAENEDRPLLFSRWPIVLLAVLACFLLLQFLPLLISRPKQKDWDGQKHAP